MSAEPRIPALDGVRAVAVLGVIASHSGLFGLGWVGVDIFFGLSGYLITGILLDAKAANAPARQFFVSFYMRRALRILPLAWAVVFIMAWVRDDWSGVFWYLGYVVNWLPNTPPPRDLGHFWSLAVEEQFYLVWPAIVFFARPRRLLQISIGLLGLDVLCRCVLSIWRPEFATDQFMGLATFARADTLIVGALLAQRERSTGWGVEPRWALSLSILSALALVALRVLEKLQLLPLLTYNLKWPVIAVGVGAGLLYVLTRPPSFLRWPWLVWIGKVSYGIYVVHALFGSWLHERFTLDQAPLIFALQLGFTLPIAAASWYLFESPILRQKWRWPMPRVSAIPARRDALPPQSA